MSWDVRKDDRCPTTKPWGVISDDDTLAGYHATEAAAVRHKKALIAAEAGTAYSTPATVVW
jgi:hypothetical protein